MADTVTAEDLPVTDAWFILGWLEGSHPDVYAEALAVLTAARAKEADRG